MHFSRRFFLKSASATALAYTSLAQIGVGGLRAQGIGALQADPNRILDLPEGFSYTVFSETGGEMSDGFFRPSSHDGMACFAHPADAAKCILVRNHEISPRVDEGGAFGQDNALVSRLSENQLYDRRDNGDPFLGGVTIAHYDLAHNRLEQDFLALAGTSTNCAGGRTPWGSWLTCEENVAAPGSGAMKPHGFVFEVPASATGPIDAVPLKDMGRFVHEAAAVDPETDIVYQTEDSFDGLFYRFLPNRRKELAQGGKLQALAIRGWKSADTRNWPLDWGAAGEDRVKVGQTFEVDWIDLQEVEAPDADLRLRGHQAGGALFARGEGMDYGRTGPDAPGSIFFNCTAGGPKLVGQVWRYTPSPEEGKASEQDVPGTLTLLYESPSADQVDMCDNLAVAPWGDLILCEDGRGEQYLRGLTPEGQVYNLARNAHEGRSEFCGACFSPDGNTLFVNIQTPGYTLAIRGPWGRARSG